MWISSYKNVIFAACCRVPFLNMSDIDPVDDTWERFFGATTDLMPSIMGAIDAIWENNNSICKDAGTIRSSAPRRSFQANSFANLSPNVQKILANVPDEDLSKNFNSEENLGSKRLSKYGKRPSLERALKSSESLEIISPNVQKILSNLPDTELVLSSNGDNNSDNKKSLVKSSSFLHTVTKPDGANISYSKSFIHNYTDCARNNSNLPVSEINQSDSELQESDRFTTSSKPLGNYLHTSPSGITSRTPVGRKNLGKFLQVPSESSMGTNSTVSSEVSRPVSLTSLGSCSSSGSSGPHQPESAYLASAESLDSDPEPSGSQGSADSGIAEQPTMSPEQCVLQEVMDTEAYYVADLHDVIEGYLKPWRSDPNCPLVPHLGDLFSNLEEIYKLNRSFLEELKLANFDLTLIANAFLHHDSGFSVYTEYCTHYPRTMTVLTELTRDENMAALFREKQLALGHALPLGSYLLKPVQRILKYHLLLQRLAKPRDNPTVDLALATMTSVATHINTMKRKHEHAVRVQEIQSQLYGWSGPDLTALGELIAEGTFRVGGARGRRHVFLFDKVFLLTKSKSDGSLAYKSHIMCSNLMLVEQVRGEPLSFHVLPFDNPRLQCTLRARSPQQKREWTLQIKRVILENYSAVIPNHARQLVMQLGQEMQDGEDTSERWSPLKQYSPPQYLERRSRGRKFRDFSNRRATSHDRSFVSLTNWRRKSEPSMVQHYNSKTMPKKITKIKKAKQQGAKFYTELSDSENGDPMQSTESLMVKNDETVSKCEDIQESSFENEAQVASNTLEQVVSDLLMQNQEFQKILNRQRRSGRDSEPCAGIWLKQNDNLPSKADSLPRDFQLNELIEGDDGEKDDVDSDARSKKQQNTDLPETDLSSSHLNEGDYPEHKIYRKSTIRLSLVQRFRAILSEEQKRSAKLPTYKQGSKNMGAKIAQPDYVDPQKLFRSVNNLSQSNFSINTANVSDLKETTENPVLDTGQDCNSSRIGTCVKKSISESELISSQNSSDSYYESIMEKNLNEEEADPLSDSFKSKRTEHKMHFSAQNETVTANRLTKSYAQFSQNRTYIVTESKIKRPTKAPPPIPVKPSRLIQNNDCSREKKSSPSLQEKVDDENHKNALESQVSSKGWVKTVVGRFE